MTESSRYRTAAFRRYAVQVFEWDPNEHNGEHEPWESMEATLDAAWPGKLTDEGVQETIDPPVTMRDTNLATERRRVVRWAWVLPVEVPAELAARCRESVSHGVLMYDPEEQQP